MRENGQSLLVLVPPARPRMGRGWQDPCHHLPLPCSAANVKKWEIELQTLRESNARLTTALQESATSVEQWKRQFSICRDENDRLRHKVGSGELRGTAGRGSGRGGPGSFSPRPLCLHPPCRRKTVCLPPLNLPPNN